MRYVIPDIHGGAKTFRALLNKINLRQQATLYLLGDYVDRGNDSRGVLDIILTLIASGYDVRPVRGNHDDMLLESAIGENDGLWLECWGVEVLKSFGVDRPEDIPARYLDLIQSMPYVRYDEQFVFVHAALDMSKDEPITETSPGVMTWGEVAPVDTARIGNRRLVVGHKIQSLPKIKASLKQNLITLDNGAFTGKHPAWGDLIALNLDTMALTVQPWIDGTN